MVIKTALVAMTLMGCDCDARLCEFISETPAQWTTIAECEAAMKTRVETRSTLNYPLVSGFCRAEEPEPGTTVALSAAASPTAQREVGASEPKRAVYDSVVDGTRIVFRRTASGYEMAKVGLGSLAGRAIDAVKSAGRFIPERLVGL